MLGSNGRLRATSRALFTAVIACVWLAAGSSAAIAADAPSFAFQFGGLGTGDGQFNHTEGVAINPASGDVYVADQMNNRVERFDASGAYLSQFGGLGPGNGQLHSQGIAVSPGNGHVFVAEYLNDRVQEFTASGAYVGQFGSNGTDEGEFVRPEGVAIDPASGDIYVVDGGNHRVQRFSSAGVYLSQFGGFGSGPGQFNLPFAIAVDPADGDVYVTDALNNRVQKFDAAGAYVSRVRQRRARVPGRRGRRPDHPSRVCRGRRPQPGAGVRRQRRRRERVRHPRHRCRAVQRSRVHGRGSGDRQPVRRGLQQQPRAGVHAAAAAGVRGPDRIGAPQRDPSRHAELHQPRRRDPDARDRRSAGARNARHGHPDEQHGGDRRLHTERRLRRSGLVHLPVGRHVRVEHRDRLARRRGGRSADVPGRHQEPARGWFREFDARRARPLATRSRSPRRPARARRAEHLNQATGRSRIRRTPASAVPTGSPSARPAAPARPNRRPTRST